MKYTYVAQWLRKYDNCCWVFYGYKNSKEMLLSAHTGLLVPGLVPPVHNSWKANFHRELSDCSGPIW